MKLSKNEMMGIFLILCGVALAVWGTVAYTVMKTPGYFTWFLGVMSLVILTLGVVLTIHRGPERIALLIAHMKCEVWQPIGPFRR